MGRKHQAGERRRELADLHKVFYSKKAFSSRHLLHSPTHSLDVFVFFKDVCVNILPPVQLSQSVQ